MYERPDALLVAVYNFSSRRQNFHYQIDLEKMKFNTYRVQKIQLFWREKRKISQATRLTGENSLPARDGILFLIKKRYEKY